jgi:4-hydroxythreonine-4-phosphate dehydrogenase
MTKPIIGITMGDAAGIGPEIIAKVLSDQKVYVFCRPVVIGDAAIMRRAVNVVGSRAKIRAVSSPAEAVFQPGFIDCVDLHLLDDSLPFGMVSPEAGNAAYQYIRKAVELAQKGRIDALCTAPLNKEALHKSGHLYPGHTEILADLTGTSKYAMMLATRKLRVVHVTTHVGLLDAIRSIDADRVHDVIRMAHEALRRAEIGQPRIAVCGINPHAGENGLFGHGEEEEKIVPAVDKARREQISATGPLPADTVFYRAVRGEFDIVVAMYHDQGHIPVKVIGLEAGVNITLGLPIVRTSVDHGTAFDIAGKGIADEGSLREALFQAAMLAPKRDG